MLKKIICLGVLLVMCLGLFFGCGNDLDEYKVTAVTAIESHANIMKAENNYTAAGYAAIEDAVEAGKQAVEDATNKGEVDTAVNDTKSAIDEINEEREMADFVLTISVDNNTKNRGEDFVVEVSLKNQSGADISISYYHSPFLANIENWQYPHPPFGLPPEPNVLVLEDGGTFTETWSLGAIGYLNPVTYESSSLPTGTHDLYFSIQIEINQSEIVVKSNTIKLIVK